MFSQATFLPVTMMLVSEARRIACENTPHIRKYGAWNRRNSCLWIPESWALEPGKQFKESGIPLTTESGIQVPLNLESSTLEPRIHSMESRIQDCLGFPYMGRENCRLVLFTATRDSERRLYSQDSA